MPNKAPEWMKELSRRVDQEIMESHLNKATIGPNPLMGDMQQIKANNQRFRHVWRLLCRTYKINGHCMKYGCGRDTLSQWVAATTHRRISPQELRKTLIHACNIGWCKKSQSLSGHSKFKLFC